MYDLHRGSGRKNLAPHDCARRAREHGDERKKKIPPPEGAQEDVLFLFNSIREGVRPDSMTVLKGEDVPLQSTQVPF